MTSVPHPNRPLMSIVSLKKAECTLTAALAARDLGLVPVPVKRGDRTPLARWKDGCDPSPGDIRRQFSNGANLAIVGGHRSNDVIDIDLDHSNASAFADILFGECPSIGRRTRPRSHRLLRCVGAKTIKLTAPKQADGDPRWQQAHGTCIAEVQADKKLITLPPSVHPCGEAYEWDGPREEIPEFQWEEVNTRLAAVTAMCVFSTYYPGPGGRHDACLAATGMLVSHGIAGDVADDLVQCAARLNQDPDWDRRGGGKSAAVRKAKGEPLAGFVGFIGALGLPAEWAGALSGWFSNPSDHIEILNPQAPYATAKRLIERRFTDEDGNLTIRKYRQQIFVYGNGGWVEFDEDAQRTEGYEFLGRAFQRTKDGVLRKVEPTPSAVSALLDALSSVVPQIETDPPAWIDGRAEPPPNEIVAFRNELVSAADMVRLPATARFWSLGQPPYPYDPTADLPHEFLAWVVSLWPEEPAMGDLLQEVFGLMMTSDTSFQKIVVLFGPPRAGKGVTTGILQTILGRSNYTSPALADLGTQFGAQSLIGKRVAFIVDARLDMSAARNGVTQTLLAVSGEDAPSVQRKYKTSWEGSLTTRFIMSTNEIPQLRDDAGALVSRFVPIVFTRSFAGQEDRGLRNRFGKEVPGIINWSLEGYQRLKARGRFHLPQSSLDLLARMAVVFSHLGSFVDDCLVIDDDAMVPIPDLYDAYRLWAAEQGVRRPMTKNQFGERMNERGFTVIQPRPEKLRRRRGIRLQNEWAKKLAQTRGPL